MDPNRRGVGVLVALCLVFLGGCATYIPAEVHKKDQIHAKGLVTGVAMEAVPAPRVFTEDVRRGGGGGGLLQALITLGIVSKLADHAKTLETHDVRSMVDDALAFLKQSGLRAVAVSETIVSRDLPSFEAKDGTFANRDFRPLQKKLNVDRLLLFRLDRVGFNYPVGGVIPIPAGDAMAEVEGAVFIVDLHTNAFLWHRKFSHLRGVGKAWDEPPSYPALTAKFYEALEAARDDVLADLSK